MKQVRSSRHDSLASLAGQITEIVQQGQARAAYGQRQLAELSTRLTELFGKGFDVSNLRNMRRFHLAFPIRETVSPELSWSHYNVLTKVENPSARQLRYSVLAEQQQLFAAKYPPYLPSKAELKHELKRERVRALQMLAQRQETQE